MRRMASREILAIRPSSLIPHPRARANGDSLVSLHSCTLATTEPAAQRSLARTIFISSLIADLTADLTAYPRSCYVMPILCYLVLSRPQKAVFVGDQRSVIRPQQRSLARSLAALHAAIFSLVAYLFSSRRSCLLKRRSCLSLSSSIFAAAS